MTFKEFIMKEMTSTGDIASFSRIAIPMMTRSWMPSIAFDMEPTENPKKKKRGGKRVFMQPQVREFYVLTRNGR